MKTAWLIGVYTTDVDCRIEDLGYTVSHVYATPEAIDSIQQGPELIVFSDDGNSAQDSMETIRHIFPKSLIISIPVSHFFLENCLSYSDKRSGEQSVARLLYQINEREHRWDN
jgi:hypothetical protein